MDQELKHGVLKTKQEGHPSPRQTVLATQWDSVKSVSEGLAQERAYQQQHMHIGYHDQNRYVLPLKENTDNLQHFDGEDEDTSDKETEDLKVYDSLEVPSHPPAKRHPTLLQTEYLDTQIDERQGTSQLLSYDAYSDLRYDPNWRTNLRRSGHFHGSPLISEEYYQVPEDKSRQSRADRQGLKINGGYAYIDTSSAIVVTPQKTDSESAQPYHLHPQDGQTSSVTSPHCHDHAFQLRSPEVDLLRSPSFSTKNESDNTLQRGFRKKRENGYDGAGENVSRASELTGDLRAVELRRTKGGTIEAQKMSASTLANLKVISNKKLERQKEDIVERNKITLGRNTSRSGSYVRVHTHKQETLHNVNKAHDSSKETASTENQEDSSDPELMWLQKTQQLQLIKGKKAQWKEYPSRSRQQQPPAPGVKAEQEECLSSPLARLPAVTQPQPPTTTSTQPLPPTIHLSISLNTSSQLLSLLQQKGQDATISLASLHGHHPWSLESKVQPSLSQGYQQTDPGKSTHMSGEWLNAERHHRHLDSSPEQWQRTSALNAPLSYEGEDQNWSPNEVHTKLPQNCRWTPTNTLSHSPHSYAVLPAIGKPVTGKDPELSPGQCVKTTYPLHGNTSNSYLLQMEKQKQLRTRVTYKAYSLKDYKQLNLDINLRGLGPDYAAIEKTSHSPLTISPSSC
uniref:jhy protein homolog isoform X1 n=1 Tax=Monopterus albus TaxID=43700 RepID=UPI0009B4E0B9|nr:uncharacterized protein LOC109972023 isoform X1 [Monopterus albus]